MDDLIERLRKHDYAIDYPLQCEAADALAQCRVDILFHESVTDALRAELKDAKGEIAYLREPCDCASLRAENKRIGSDVAAYAKSLDEFRDDNDALRVESAGRDRTINALRAELEKAKTDVALGAKAASDFYAETQTLRDEVERQILQRTKSEGIEHEVNAERDALRAELSERKAYSDGCDDAISSLRAEVQRLRGALEKIAKLVEPSFPLSSQPWIEIARAALGDGK